MANLGALFLDTARSNLSISSSTTADLNPTQQKQVVDFLTIQSLSFPLASLGVNVAWEVLQASFEASWADQTYVPLIIAGTIVLASFFGNWSSLTGAPAKVGGFIIGAVNTLLLAAGALGIDVAT